MTTPFRKLLAPPSPRRMMVEFLVIWLVVDAVMLWCAVSRHDEEWLRPIAFRINPVYATALLLICAGQLSVSLLWSFCGPGRWPERVLLPSGLLCGVALLWRIMSLLLDGQVFPPLPEITAYGGLTLLVHGGVFGVVAFAFLALGAQIRPLPDQINSTPESFYRVTLADLFVLTAAVAMICFVGLTIPRDDWRSWPSWEGAGAFQWILFPSSLFAIMASLCRGRLIAYLLWLGIPLAILNGIAVFIVVGNWGLEMLVREWLAFVIGNVMLLIYPLAMILSLEYLRLRGYAFAGKRQSNPMTVIPPTACAAGDGR